MRILENELSNTIKQFNGKDLVVKFGITMKGTYIFYKAKVEYNFKTGMLHIVDSKNNTNLTLCSSFFENVEYRNNKLVIQLDSELKIELSKK